MVRTQRLLQGLGTSGVFALVGACVCRPPGQFGEEVIVAKVVVESPVKANCLAVEVLDLGGARLRESPRIPREAARSDYYIAVYRTVLLPSEVNLRAVGSVGPDCAALPTPNASSASVLGRFEPAKAVTVELVLAAPVAADDQDRDGYRAKALGGPDCDDGRADVHPEAPESCSSTTDDLDCDTLKGCADPSCINQPCGPKATCCNGACASEVCDDGADNDCDLTTDCGDPDCSAGPPETKCGDGKDNDCDALPDCADDNCAGQACAPGLICDPAAKSCTLSCVKVSITEVNCGDGTDDDCDGLTDCADTQDCLEGAACGANGKKCQQRNCACSGNGGTAEPVETICNDNADNDCDGLTDCADVAGCPMGTACGANGRGCQAGGCVCSGNGGTAEPAETICNDNADNDCDGLTDCPEAACGGKCCSPGLACTGGACAAAPSETNCANAADDDCDGLADCADTASCPDATTCGTNGRRCQAGGCVCSGNGGTAEPAETICNDNADNDCDGLTDCVEAACGGRCCSPGQVCAAATCVAAPSETNCANAADDDCDGLTDCADTASCPDATTCGANGRRCQAGGCVCSGNGGTAEPVETICNDNADNDCDGLTDCAEAACGGKCCSPGLVCAAATCVAAPSETNCLNAIDDDCDGLTDCADPDCLPVLGAVKTGTCVIATGLVSVTCALAPPLGDMAKTFMVFQATSAANRPDTSNVRCYLASPASIICERNAGDGSVNIRWHAAEFTRGATVEHLQPPCTGTTTNVPVTPVASMASTFLLFSGENDGPNPGTDDFRMVRLTSPSNVEIRQSAGCGAAEQSALQVVQLGCASVTRGLAGPVPAASISLAMAGLPAADLARTFLLYSYRSVTVTAAMCTTMVRGEVASPTSLLFSRGDGAAGCATTAIDEISWERVELPAGMKVQQVGVALATGAASATSAVAAVDPAKTVLFAGGQWTCGQGVGEGSFSGDDIPGDMIGRHSLASSTQLVVERDSSSGTARWTSYVVQLAP